jgi:hypothetical protein
MFKAATFIDISASYQLTLFITKREFVAAVSCLAMFNAVCHKVGNYIKNVKNIDKKTEALYNTLLPMKIVSFDGIVQKSLGIIKGSPNRKYVYRKYVKRLVESGKLQTKQ